MSSMYFYGIFFFGASFVLLAIVWIARDNRKNRKLVGKAEVEKEELLSIIEDAELMVNELNHFSDYILTKIEEKNVTVGDSIEKLEEKLEAVREDRENSEKRDEALGRTADRTPVYHLKKQAGAHRSRNVAAGLHNEAVRAEEAGAAVLTAEAGAGGHTKEESAVEAAIAETVAEAAEETAAKTAEEISEEEPENLPEASSGAPIIVFSRKDGDNIVPEYHKNRVKYENRKYKQVLQYAQEGLSESEIAQQLNIGKGEVRLILGLTESEATSRI